MVSHLYLPNPATLSDIRSADARIKPTSLILRTRSAGRSTSHKVDFVVACKLRGDRSAMNRLKELAAASSSTMFSINQTGYSPLLAAPIAVSIKTRKTGEEWDKAQLQLGTWSVAGLNKLEQMLRQAWPDGEEWREHMPEFLPLVVVQGHEWSFLAVTRNADDETVRMYFKQITDMHHMLTQSVDCLEIGPLWQYKK